MAFTVEDGTGKSDANSLTSVSDADTHLAGTGYTAGWASFLQGRKEELLVTATRIICNSFAFGGTLLLETQALSFPRKDLYDREERLITGVPSLVKNCVAELAFTLSQENYIEDSELGSLNSIKVGPISLEVSDSASITKIIPDSIIRMMSEYGTYRFGKMRMRRLVAG